MRPIYQANEVARRAAERQLMRSIRSLTRSVPSRVDLAIEVRGFDPEDEQHLLALAKKEMSSRGYRLIRVESETSTVSALKVTMQPADTVYNGKNPAACGVADPDALNAESAARR